MKPDSASLPVKNQKNLAVSPVLLCLFFISGSAGLLYEILWMKAFKLLTGSTAEASACVLAAYFAGLSAGSAYGGKRALRLKNPLRTYAALEAGIALAALLYFPVWPLYRQIYSPLFMAAGNHTFLQTTLGFALAAGIIFLPAFFMGATLPAVLTHAVRRPEDLGKRAGLFYAVNTAGAALGAALAAFFPLTLGLHHSYLATVFVSLTVAFISFVLSFSAAAKIEPSPVPSREENRVTEKSSLPRKTLAALAFLSGFITLALEVLWTQMFAQVLQNSVYTFSTLTAVFLLALAAGSVLASWLSRLKGSPGSILSVLIALAGFSVLITPFIFHRISNGMDYLQPPQGWDHYFLFVLSRVAVTLGGPAVILGTVFPYLLKASESISGDAAGRRAGRPGETSGRLLAVNALGSIAGSLTGGFFLLQYAGLWNSIRLMSVFYFLASLFFPLASHRLKKILRLISCSGFLLSTTFLDPSHLPMIKLDPKRQEKLLELWEGRYGTVAVVRSGPYLKLRANNVFGLGGDETRQTELHMADLPLVLHPEPASVLFLGMGTGITAGAALDHPAVQNVTVCELVPEVARAAKKYFSRYHLLFSSHKARVVIDDARHYLSSRPEKYDAIVGDLFFPWEAGTGSLYALEHFRTVASRLNEGGIYAQWLPLYQISEREFSVIARTLLEVFPQVTLWRGDFSPDRPIAAFVARNSPAPLDPKIVFRNFLLINVDSPIPPSMKKITPYMHYAGNLTAAKKILRDFPVNTDDRPVIEHLSPLSYLAVQGNVQTWFTGTVFAGFCERLLAAAPPESDPYLKGIGPLEKNAVRAGLLFYKAECLMAEKKTPEAQQNYREVCNLLGGENCAAMKINLGSGAMRLPEIEKA